MMLKEYEGFKVIYSDWTDRFSVKLFYDGVTKCYSFEAVSEDNNTRNKGKISYVIKPSKREEFVKIFENVLKIIKEEKSKENED